jgi:hypothetical protein
MIRAHPVSSHTQDVARRLVVSAANPSALVLDAATALGFAALTTSLRV